VADEGSRPRVRADGAPGEVPHRRSARVRRCASRGRREVSAPDVSALSQLADIRGRIVGLADLLGPDELAVLELVAHGLARGRNVYGELVLATDARDMTCEASQEIRDALVYLGAQLVRLNRGAK
jgi:hypothetical protein